MKVIAKRRTVLPGPVFTRGVTFAVVGVVVVAGVDGAAGAGAVGVAAGALWLAKDMFCETSSLLASPKVISQLSPAAICAAVGGQGYFAASVAALPLELSVPVPGGPTVPVWTTKVVVGRAPLLLVDTKVDSGLVQDTGT